MKGLNVLYGLLTNGDSTTRKTEIDNYAVSEEAARILAAIMPTELSAAGKRALAELYIRLIYTDEQLIRKLKKVDPINSYALHAFYPDFLDGIDLNTLVTGIKELALEDEEITYLPVDYLRNALDKLLDRLDG